MNLEQLENLITKTSWLTESQDATIEMVKLLEKIVKNEELLNQAFEEVSGFKDAYNDHAISGKLDIGGKRYFKGAKFPGSNSNELNWWWSFAMDLPYSRYH